MSTLEHEIVDLFNQLDSQAQARVRAALDLSKFHYSVPARPDFDFDEWDREVEEILEDIRQDNGGVFPEIDAMEMLQSFREGTDEDA